MCLKKKTKGKKPKTLVTKEYIILSRGTLVILMLSGLTLIIGSILIPENGFWGFLKELAKELGIVVMAVFTVSFIYEIALSKKYLANFLDLLKSQIEQGESNASTCAHLGIREIYRTRDKFEIAYPLSATIEKLSPDSQVRIVGVSLFLIMSKSEVIKAAITKGCKIELSLYDPGIDGTVLEKIQDLMDSDIHSTVKVFKKNIVEWIKQESPAGSVKLSFHKITLFDSFFSVSNSNDDFCVWDLSFGRDTTRKRIFLLDPHKPLGSDICERYNKIYKDAKVVFQYENSETPINELDNILGISVV